MLVLFNGTRSTVTAPSAEHSRPMVTLTTLPSGARDRLTERMNRVPASESLSKIVTVALLIAPMLAPKALVRKTENDSLPSTTQSSISGTRNVAKVWPLVNSSVVAVCTKSLPAVAVPLRVATSTEAAPALPPDRSSVITALGSLSLTT
ncbi:hypothetical protein LBMAG56_02490 [Verrucomicrobiota bacterium]|nr:hypothetical protein LBMAG56_02490 [Verrucomicrobiota bacterium]